MTPPFVIASCAISLDGCLDAAGGQRLVLSHPDDLARVDEIRASCDAVLVGANTIRRDDPRLLVRSETLVRERVRGGRTPQPLKVTLTRTGNLDPGQAFFTAGSGERLVFSTGDAAGLSARLGAAARVVALPPDAGPAVALEELGRRGVARLLVEGGRQVLTAFLADGLVHELRVATAPFFLGEADAPRVVGPATFPYDAQHRMPLAAVERVGDMVVATYRLRRPASTLHATDDRRFLADAIELSRRCPPSATAFSVGAVVVRAGAVVSTGFSREERNDEHAEELALRRAVTAGESLRGCTLYSSLEPCSMRKSGRRACCDRIVEAGIARVVYASAEPPVFVPGRGAVHLRVAGVDVLQCDEMADAVRQVNAHLPWGQ